MVAKRIWLCFDGIEMTSDAKVGNRVLPELLDTYMSMDNLLIAAPKCSNTCMCDHVQKRCGVNAFVVEM